MADDELPIVASVAEFLRAFGECTRSRAIDGLIEEGKILRGEHEPDPDLKEYVVLDVSIHGP